MRSTEYSLIPAITLNVGNSKRTSCVVRTVSMYNTRCHRTHLHRFMRRFPSILAPALRLVVNFLHETIHHQLRQQIKVFPLVLGDVCRAKDRRGKGVVREKDKVLDRLECSALELRSLFLSDRAPSVKA